MRYSILIYDNESVVDALTKDEHAARLKKHIALQDKFREGGKLGPVARLMPTTAATTIRKAAAGNADNLVLDGPFAETKEQLVGFYILECDSLEEAIEAAKMLPLDSSSLEIRPIVWYDDGA